MKMIIQYIVSMNGLYMNTFKSYNDAIDLKENLKRRYKGAKVEIIEDTFFQ